MDLCDQLFLFGAILATATTLIGYLGLPLWLIGTIIMLMILVPRVLEKED